MLQCIEKNISRITGKYRTVWNYFVPGVLFMPTSPYSLHYKFIKKKYYHNISIFHILYFSGLILYLYEHSI